MTDREALLRAVCADPADDLPRLAFADLCEEEGDLPRADFIRAQLLIAEKGRGFVGRETLLAEEEWFCGHAAPLLAEELPEDLLKALMPVVRVLDGQTPRLVSANNNLIRVTYRRGFLEMVRCPFHVWLDCGPEVVGRHPIVEVGASDKKPFQLPHRSSYFWETDVNTAGPSVLPSRMTNDWPFDVLHPEVGNTRIIHPFDTGKEAYAALNAAMLRAVAPTTEVKDGQAGVHGA